MRLAEFTLGHIPLLSTEDAVAPELISLFQESEKQLDWTEPSGVVAQAGGGRLVLRPRARLSGEMESLRSFDMFHTTVSPYTERPAPEQKIRYVSTTGAIRDRLELMGVSITGVENHYETHRQRLIDELDVSEHGEWIRAHFRDTDLDKWSACLRRVLEQHTRYEDFVDTQWNERPFEGFMLSTASIFLLGFPGDDLWLLLRAVCESAPPSTPVVYDLTVLTAADEDGNSIDQAAPLATLGRHALASFNPLANPIIVLTEGKTDQRFLSRSMTLRMPHVSEFFSFSDFAVGRNPGGAGHLVAVFKAFISAGVANRTIALFDNDTAARAAVRGMAEVDVPENMRLLHYPPLRLAERYPTMGPTGDREMDVNGLAGSLELYLGEDVLRTADGLAPVHWKGWESALQQYQGELLDKKSVQSRFAEKLDAAEAGAANAEQDWSGIDSILGSVVGAFSDTYGTRE